MAGEFNYGLADVFGNQKQYGSLDSGLSSFNTGNNTALQTPNTSFLGSFGDNSSAFGDIASGLGGLASSFAALKQLGLAKDAFKFNKAMKQKEYAMAKDAYDRNVARADSISNQVNKGKVG